MGLAVGRALSMKGIECLICERHGHLGTETSSRNSEVIHAGMYYATGSNKARFCVDGKETLFDYIKDRGIGHNICGKLIIAHDEIEHQKLAAIEERAVANGVCDLKSLSAGDVRLLEPAVQCHSALISPRTGIVDSHGLMQALLGDFERGSADGMGPGGLLVYNCAVRGVSSSPEEGSRYLVDTNQGGIGCDMLINAGGLHAVNVASVIEPYPKSRLPKSYFCKGNYFKFQPPASGGTDTASSSSRVFRHLVYPIPPTAHTGLGVHSTIDLNGSVKFGPDTEWLRPPPHMCSNDTGNPDREFEFTRPTHSSSSGGQKEFISTELGNVLSYVVDPSRCDSFYTAIRRYYPALPDDSLVPDYAGIRPKLCGPSGIAGSHYNSADFYIESHRQHGLPGLVNLFGLESPALTASISIAEHVCDLLANEKY